jgi:hypothetical protein
MRTNFFFYRTVDVNETQLISISDSAEVAFETFEWSEHEGKGIRLFVQGFG